MLHPIHPNASNHTPSHQTFELHTQILKRKKLKVVEKIILKQQFNHLYFSRFLEIKIVDQLEKINQKPNFAFPDSAAI